MDNRHQARGFFLVAISLIFGLWSLHYQVGGFDHAGPGLFPLLVSSVLLLIGIATLVRARLAPAPITFNARNVAIVIGSLSGFALISQYLNMTAGIVFMVFSSTSAGTSYSWVRNVKICAGLLAIAFAMSRFLGVNLPLY